MRSKRSKFQQEFSVNEDPETGRNDYEDRYLEHSVKGPFIVHDGYLGGLDLDFFSHKLLNNYREKFRKEVERRINKEDLEKIEKGIEAYGNSAVSADEDLKRLKLSIKRFKPSAHYNPRDKALVYSKLDYGLITTESLKLYQKIAEKHTKFAFKRYITYRKKEAVLSEAPKELGDIPIYRGFNNRHYYKPNNTDSDIISRYATSNFDQFYEEENILTSYTLTTPVADQFMTASKSRRRAFISGGFDCIEGRVFTSFVVSQNLVEQQFELLCFKNDYNLLIQDQKNDEEWAQFSIMRKD